MGITICRRERGESNWDFFAKEIGNLIELIELAQNDYHTLVGLIAYRDGTSVEAFVVEQRFRRDWYNFSFRTMHESECPLRGILPLKFLLRLTPTSNEYAKEFRNRSLRYAAITRSLPTIQIGDEVIISDTPTKVVYDPEYQVERIKRNYLSKIKIIRDGKIIFDSESLTMECNPDWKLDLAKVNWRNIINMPMESSFDDLINFMQKNMWIKDKETRRYGGRYLVYKKKDRWSISDRFIKKAKGYVHYILTQEGVNEIKRIALQNIL